MDPFVTPQWLAEHRAEVVLADARTYLDGRNAEAEYLQGHLPGAVFVDVGADLAERGVGQAEDVHERAGESLLRWVERDLLA